jgi:hypothetical protein
MMHSDILPLTCPVQRNTHSHHGDKYSQRSKYNPGYSFPALTLSLVFSTFFPTLAPFIIGQEISHKNKTQKVKQQELM